MAQVAIFKEIFDHVEKIYRELFILWTKTSQRLIIFTI